MIIGWRWENRWPLSPADSPRWPLARALCGYAHFTEKQRVMEFVVCGIVMWRTVWDVEKLRAYARKHHKDNKPRELPAPRRDCVDMREMRAYWENECKHRCWEAINDPATPFAVVLLAYTTLEAVRE